MTLDKQKDGKTKNKKEVRYEKDESGVRQG